MSQTPKKSRVHVTKTGGAVKCRAQITMADTLRMAKKIGIDWDKVLFKPTDLKRGMKVELEHGKCLAGKPSRETNVTNDDLEKTARIALAHLKEEFRYYHLRLGLPAMEKKMEKTRPVATQKAKKAKSRSAR